MGTVCCGTRPSKQFVGIWTDNKNTVMAIDETGSIEYKRQTAHSSIAYKGPTRFKKNRLHFCCCCCCSLRGEYIDGDDLEPRLVVNGSVLTKKQ